MQNKKNVLTPLILATLFTSVTGTAFAATTKANAPTQAQRVAPAQAGRRAQGAQNQAGQQRPERQAMQVAYYSGDPLKGGQRLSTKTVTAPADGPQGGRQEGAQQGANPLAQNAPKGATHAVITTPFGRRVVNLSSSQNAPHRGDAEPGGLGQGDPGGRGQDGNGGGRNAGPQNGGARDGGRNGQVAPDGQRNGGGMDGGTRGPGGPDGGAGRGASAVTYYAGDPLAGGKAIRTVQLGQADGRNTALPQAPQGAKFAVFGRGGEQVIVDLMAAPQGR